MSQEAPLSLSTLKHSLSVPVSFSTSSLLTSVRKIYASLHIVQHSRPYQKQNSSICLVFSEHGRSSFRAFSSVNLFLQYLPLPVVPYIYTCCVCPIFQAFFLHYNILEISTTSFPIVTISVLFVFTYLRTSSLIKFSALGTFSIFPQKYIYAVLHL